MPDVEVDRSIIKITAFAAVSALFVFFFGYELRHLVEEPTGGRLIFTLAAGMLWLATAVLHPYVIKSVRVGIFAFLIEIGALVGALAGKELPLIAAVTAPLFLFLVSGFVIGRRALTNSVKIKFFQHGSRIMQAFATGLSLFLALYLAASFSVADQFVTERSIRFFLGGSEPILRRYLPDFSLGAPVGDVLRNVAARQLPPGAPPALLDQAVQGLLAQIRERTGASIRASDSVLQVVTRFANDRFGSLSRNMKLVTLAVIALLIFLTVKGLAFLINWPILVVSFAFYEFLLAFRFMHLEFETVQKEIIVVK